MTDNIIKTFNDRRTLHQRRKKVEKKLSNLSTDEYRFMRNKLKTDLCFLAYTIGFTDLSPVLHGHLAKWLALNIDAQYKLILLPRGHFKTSLLTIADSVRLALPDTYGNRPYPESLGPDIRILIAHEAERQAETFLHLITNIILGNPVIQAFFPEIIPNKNKHRINRNELELNRSRSYPEPTFGTIGVGGRSQGKHYSYIKADDLIGEEARASKAVMLATIEWVDGIQSLLDNITKDKIDFIGTRWAPNDLYKHIMNQYGNKLLRYVRSVEELDATTNTLVPIFPERFNRDYLEILKRNPLRWSANYVNNPELSGRLFVDSWKRYFEWLPGRYSKKLYIHGPDNSRQEYDVADLDRLILIDPAMSGNLGIIVTGGTRDKKIFILEAIKRAMKPPEFLELLFMLFFKWQPRAVVIEEVLFSGLYEHWLKAEMKARRVSFNVITHKVGNKSKEARIVGLTSFYAAGTIFHHPSQKDLDEEYNTFSSVSFDDHHLMDALSQGPFHWSIPKTQAFWQDYRETESKVLNAIDSVTGYSTLY